MGLGPVRLFALTEVRKKVVAAQKLLADGFDPLVEKRAAQRVVANAAGAPTFETVSAEFIASRKGAWRDGKRAARWATSLKTHAAAISRLPVTDVTTDDVLRGQDPRVVFSTMMWRERERVAT